MSPASVTTPTGIWYPTVRLRWFAAQDAAPVLQQCWISLSGDEHDWRAIEVAVEMVEA